MANLNFPTSPTLNQVHTENGKTWRWSGVSWVPDSAQGVSSYDDLSNAPSFNSINAPASNGPSWVMRKTDGSVGLESRVVGGVGNLALGIDSHVNANSSAEGNMAIGNYSQPALTSGYYNTSVGGASLLKVTSGHSNVAIGTNSLKEVTTGTRNIGIGVGAGLSITTGVNNIYIGEGITGSGAAVSNEIAIGRGSVGQGSNTVNLGNSSTTKTKLNGNLDFSGVGVRLLGDFSNATHSNRSSFQSVSLNTETGVQFLPNGTSNSSSVQLLDSSDADNTAFLLLGSNNTEHVISAEKRGSGSYKPISIYSGGVLRVSILSDGTINFLTTTNAVTKDWGTNDTQVSTTAFVDRLRDIPGNSKSVAYTLVMEDRGTSIDTSNNIVIPSNAQVAFPIGTTIMITNTALGNRTISITTDQLRLAGTTTLGSRTLANFGVCVIRKIASTTWIIYGAGLS